MKQDQGPKYLEYQIEKAQGTWSQAIAEPFFACLPPEHYDVIKVSSRAGGVPLQIKILSPKFDKPS